MNAEQFVTDFADQAVILPLLLMVAIALWWCGWRRGALAWAIGVAASQLGLTWGVLRSLASNAIFRATGRSRRPR